jgi:hypothetical protein
MHRKLPYMLLMIEFFLYPNIHHNDEAKGRREIGCRPLLRQSRRFT